MNENLKSIEPTGLPTSILESFSGPNDLGCSPNTRKKGVNPVEQLIETLTLNSSEERTFGHSSE